MILTMEIYDPIVNRASFMSFIGRVLRRRFFFTDTIDGFNQLMKQTKFYQRKEKFPYTLFGMEPSEYCWIHLYEYLIRLGK